MAAPRSDFDRPDIVAALRDAEGNIGKAAKKLRTSRRTLQNRMREYGMPTGRPGRRKQRLSYNKGTRAALYGLGAATAAVVVGGLAWRKLGGRSA